MRSMNMKAQCTIQSLHTAASGTPLLKDLHNAITSNYAARWRVIGTLLGLPKGKLDIIEHDNYHKAEPCCDAVLEEWLETDPFTSWDKLLKVIDHDDHKSPAVPIDRASDKGVSMLSERVKKLNIQTRFTVDEDIWPPYKPTDFIPALLIHHGQHTIEQATALQLAESMQLGGVHPKHYPQNSHQSLREALNDSKTTKQLVDLLSLLQDSDIAHLILIDGLSGIGKSFLMQEIAYNWATNNLLQKFKLVLLVRLRSPAVQKVLLVDDLLRLFCKGDRKGAEIATASSEYIFKNGGKDVVFLFDGYDEFPASLQKDSLIADILKRQVLPCCGLVVSSRPHASVLLRKQATIRVDILGFANEERKLCIEQCLKGQLHAIKELTEYLESNLIINGLCFIPFNMVVLIYLYKQGIPLPSNSTQLYNYFICLTICRHLAKSGQPLDNTITDLTNFPEPCNTLVQQLSNLSLQGLNNNKLIFTLEEIRAACPGIEGIEGALSGFGLLQTVEHFGLTGKAMTFNFIHFSIQEFLAAYHITQLPQDKELQVLEAKFWSNLHSNMFTMYTSLTKGQRCAFKQFLSGGDNTILISKLFLENQLRYLQLFRCFHEANDKAFYTYILNSTIFNDKVIDFYNTNLTVYDVECITLFLTISPYKEWKLIDLSYCHIKDRGLYVLHRDLIPSDITIRQLNLSYNGLTRSSSPFISDLTIHCKIKVLGISGNCTIGEDPALYNMLSDPSSMLVELDMRWTSLSSPSASILFTALGKSNKLQELNINNNSITDEACDTMAASLKSNISLVRLEMHRNKMISSEAAQRLLQALQHSNTLELLWLPRYTEDIEKRIRLLQEEVNKTRESRGSQTKLNVYCWYT